MAYVNIPTHYHNVVQRDLDPDSLDILENITLVLSFDDIILNRSEEQEVANTLKAMVRHMNSKRWKTNSMNIQRPNIQ